MLFRSDLTPLSQPDKDVLIESLYAHVEERLPGQAVRKVSRNASDHDAVFPRVKLVARGADQVSLKKKRGGLAVPAWPVLKHAVCIIWVKFTRGLKRAHPAVFRGAAGQVPSNLLYLTKSFN